MSRRDDGGFGVEQFEDALAGGHRRLQDVVFVAEVLDGAEEALRVLDEGDEDAEGHGGEDGVAQSVGNAQVAEDGVAAKPDDESDGGGAKELDDGVIESVGKDRVRP